MIKSSGNRDRGRAFTGAPSPQTLGGKVYRFTSWSDSGAATHPISTPPTDPTYTASFSLLEGLQYYPLSRPIRLLDTRPGQPACAAPGSPILAGVPRTEIARTVCEGVGIPANALSILGNATVVNVLPGAQPGYITLYPSGSPRPTVSNLDFAAGQIIPNSFNVRLDESGAFDLLFRFINPASTADT